MVVDMESRQVTTAIGRKRARTGCDIRICGVVVGGSLAGQQIIEAASAPVGAQVHVAREEGQQVHHALSAALSTR